MVLDDTRFHQIESGPLVEVAFLAKFRVQLGSNDFAGNCLYASDR